MQSFYSITKMISSSNDFMPNEAAIALGKECGSKSHIWPERRFSLVSDRFVPPLTQCLSASTSRLRSNGAKLISDAFNIVESCIVYNIYKSFCTPLQVIVLHCEPNLLTKGPAEHVSAK